MKRAMISSTSIDLPEHRKQVIEACQRMDFFPEAMEHLPARDANAIRASLELVDKADLYLGIFAWRYGHIPDGRRSPSPNRSSTAPLSAASRFWCSSCGTIFRCRLSWSRKRKPHRKN